MSILMQCKNYFRFLIKQSYPYLTGRNSAFLTVLRTRSLEEEYGAETANTEELGEFLRDFQNCIRRNGYGDSP